jgi:DNA-binding transcriptional regulator YhcF (GntR family)
MKPLVDPQSPIPLYHQIAQALRARIESGELEAGALLAPLKLAAEQWGVNLHTVRHAYAALAREGLVQSRRALGTRVAAARSRVHVRDAPDEHERFLREVLRGAAELGLSRGDLARALLARPGAASDVYVVECSAWQCAAHAQELAAAWDVSAHPWPLSNAGEPPDGLVVSTYFHYNDLRRRWPRRMNAVRFLTIAPEPALVERLARLRPKRGRFRLLVIERDRETAEAVAADVSAALGDLEATVEPRVGRVDARSLARLGRGALALLAPRVWAGLDDELRAHERVLEIRYVFAPAELAALGRDLGWAPARRRA